MTAHLRACCYIVIVLQGATIALAAPVSDHLFWYQSSVTSNVEGRLKLSARLNYDDARTSAPIAVVMHWFGGNGGDVTNNAQRLRDQGFFAISVAMRGRNGSEGTRDAGGVEIHDIYDAVEAVKAEYPSLVDPTTVYITGYSGGGGNVMSALTKFPDYFRAGAAFYGISDYGYDATNGFWGTSPGDQRQLTADIGDKASGDPAVLDRYMARASNLASRNNAYSEIHLFVNDNEDRCAPIHATSYRDMAVAAAASQGEFDNIHVHVANSIKPEYVDFNGNKHDDADERQWWPHGLCDADQQHAGEAWFMQRLLTGTIPRPQLKPSGELFVAGFVRTRPLSCWLGDGQNAAGSLKYSLTADRKTFELKLLSHDKNVSGWLEVDTQDMAGRPGAVLLDGVCVGQFTGGRTYRYEDLRHAQTLALVVNALTTDDTANRFLPPESLNMSLAAPIDSWDEAIPLGNGLLGGLLWGRDDTIRLSLDRGDLWDLRVQDELKKDDFTWKTMQRLVAEKNQAELARRFDALSSAPWPTKLPAGRLELTLDPVQTVNSFTLDLAKAIGSAELGDGSRMEAFFDATTPVVVIRIPGPAPREVKLLAPAVLQTLEYPAAIVGADGDTQWFLQKTLTDFSYAVIVSSRRGSDGTLLALTIASSGDGSDPVGLGRQRVAKALKSGYANVLAPHEAWWRDFWRKSRVELPELNHLRHYYLAQYFYGAASRLGSPPMPLQGVWTADNGELPPWHGDYHNNLNTQMTYAAYQAAGRFDEGLCFLDLLWKLLPEFRAFAQKFYEVPGAVAPGVMALDGKPMGGWSMYSFHPTNAAWVGYLFYQHWRYTMDEGFLRDRAYPWCEQTGLSLLHLLKSDVDGVLRLPLSSSPELHDNSLQAWLKPNSNYDHDCMASLFTALAEMADALGKTDDAAKWRTAVAGLGQRAVDPQTNRLMIAPGESLGESHRHLAHTMSIYPFGLLNIDGSAHDRDVIAATFKQYDELGTQCWVGYSFAWAACLRARTGDAEGAIRNLDIFEKAFIMRNGFHANGDQLAAGYSKWNDHQFTLEGNCLAAQAVHEMLLQSWDGVIRVFPATPLRWSQAAFDDLRAEGGYRVSARRENSMTAWFTVSASRDGLVKIRDNFDDRTPVWSQPGVEHVGDNWQYQIKAGETLEARLPTPTKP